MVRFECHRYMTLIDRVPGPSIHRRVEVRAVHIMEAWRHNDADGQVIAFLRQHGELRQLGQGDVHSEGGAFALPGIHSRGDVSIDRASRYQSIEQQLGIYPADNVCRLPSFATCYRPGRAALGDDDFLDRMTKQNIDAASRHALAIACVIEPIPPIACPPAPGTPAASPDQRLNKTYAVTR